MKLGRKNLIYSISLAGVLLLFLVGYFIYMLPSLYVDHIMEENLKSIREQHKAYMEDRSYEDIQVRNATSCFSVELPKEGNCIRVVGKAFLAELVIQDQRIYEILDRWREKLDFWFDKEKRREAGKEKGDFSAEDIFGGTDGELEELEEIFREALEGTRALPVELTLHVQDMEENFFG